MQHKQWVAPELNYVLPPPGSTRDVDFERPPKFTSKSEMYVVDKISHWIYSSNLSLEYFSKQHKVNKGNDLFTFSATNQTFEHSLEQLFKNNPEQRATLNQTVNCFMSAPFNQACHNIRFWMQSSIRTSYLSVRPWTSFGRPAASAFTSQTRFYLRIGFYRLQTR